MNVNEVEHKLIALAQEGNHPAMGALFMRKKQNGKKNNKAEDKHR